MESAASLGLEELENLPDGGSIMMSTDAESYLDIVMSILDRYCATKKLPCIYLAASIPASTLDEAMRSMEVDMKGVRFIDCISYSLAYKRQDNVQVVESPTMLEGMLLKMEYLYRVFSKKGGVVIIDSVNSLALHNEVRMMSEFAHLIVSSGKARGMRVVFLSVEEQTRPEYMDVMAMVCDRVVSVKGMKVH
jgi:KaiC/GvpD/RAD55 family RecA-like ATPase